MDILTTNGISKQFSNHRALDKVSIHVPENSIFGLLGPNGAGKTTLIRIINNILAPDEGELFLDGKKLQPSDVYKIGYLPEERGLYKKMNVGEQALYLAQLKGLSRQEALKRLKIWFEKFEIQGWWNRKVEELSKGMQQKVQFVVTVIHEPHLLIFDEPFSGFDPINVNLLKEEILELKRKGSTIIFSTHNMASVEELCDHIALIDKSHKILEGDIWQIRKTYKTHTFEVEYSGTDDNPSAFLPENFKVLDYHHVNEHYSAKVQLPAEARPNDLLSFMMDHYTIEGFREIIPGMNEIFIRLVTGNDPDISSTLTGI
ncbi:MAG: ABC transporter ATP-binding protein [Bacteroidota bacterium]|nr:ABC transporter ATP-binding protein [Bacteroidota bacterium]